MSIHNVHQPNACIRMSDIVVRENGARGKCLPSALFQGFHEGRHTEREIDGFTADAMELLISWSDQTDMVCSIGLVI